MLLMLLMIFKNELNLIGTYAVKHPHNTNIKESSAELDAYIRGGK